MYARRLEFIQVRHIEPAIPGAAGDDDRARAHALFVEQPQHIFAGVCLDGRLESNRFVRDRHLDPEFLSLIVRARHQGHARNARGKA